MKFYYRWMTKRWFSKWFKSLSQIRRAPIRRAQKKWAHYRNLSGIPTED